MRKYLLIALVGCTVLVAPRRASAWGPEGHKIVAFLAEERLTDAAREQIKELIGKAYLSSIANEADYFGPQNPKSERGEWHYIDIRVGAKKSEIGNFKNGGNNVLDRIEFYRGVLADTSNSKEKRREALSYIVHFVGDMHQPLHCAERLNADGEPDRGGNNVFTRYKDLKPELHKVWDGGLIREMMEDETQGSWVEFARKLHKETVDLEDDDPDLVACWGHGTLASWAWAAHRLAVTDAYANIPKDTSLENRFELDDGYVRTAKGTIRSQLKKGGYRLAQILNEALK